MSKLLNWEGLLEGQELEPLENTTSTQQLVKYAGASHDYYQIHYDKDYAISKGLDGIIVHGALRCALLGRLITNWMGSNGFLKKLSCQYRGIDLVGDKLTCKGIVARKYEESGNLFCECDIWIENAKGDKTTVGSATIKLQSGELT